MGKVSNPVTGGITRLEEIYDIPLDEVVKTFMDSLQSIYQHAQFDIQDTLGKLENETLTEIHKKFCENIILLFPEYKDKRCVNRQVKHKLVADIHSIGYCVVNKNTTRELEKIFVHKSVQNKDNVNGDLTELANLVKVVITLRERFDRIEKDLRILKSDNVSLVEKVKLLENLQDQDGTKDRDMDDAIISVDSASDSEPPTDDKNTEVVLSQQQTVDTPNSPPRDVSEETENSEVDVPATEFTLPPRQLKKLRRNERRRKAKVATNLIEATGNKQTRSPIEAAPQVVLSDIHVYVGHVSPKHSQDDIREHLKSMGVNENVAVSTLCAK
jgi:hypothetical protein